MNLVKNYLLAMVLCLFSGCMGDPVREPVVLADLHFSTGGRDTVPAAEEGWRSPWHRLGSGWDRSGRKGTWTLGHDADLDLFLLGENLELTIRCRTARRLARRGQQLTVLLNGTLLDSTAVSVVGADTELSIALPRGIVVPGLNRVTLRAALYDREADREFALYIKHVGVTGWLSHAEREQYFSPAGCEWNATELAHEQLTTAETNAASVGLNPGMQPDLLIILLDAARSDHFGCYGYARDTTPNIDRLAAAGLRFEQVTATAPYTLCSVASLFTGRNWVEHGVVHRGDTPPEHLPVLAGIMRANGYTTLGFSENPFVSHATGSDRGFSEFKESWLDSQRTTVEQVLSRINRLPAADPVMCYIHFMPPHEPYDPQPEHDLFTDPTYDGPVNGGSTCLRAIDRAQMTCTPDDLAYLIGLYDGNLHMADHWTDQILSAWQELGRQRDLLTVIVSDHGEAFGEHQRFGHNSTLYREMMEVPLVLHPRGLCEQLTPALTSLRSLSDVTPLLLRILDIPLPSGTTWPRHFLRLYRGDYSDRRLIPLRPSHEAFIGVRTPEVLAIHGNPYQQELYDVLLDPHNNRNIRVGRPEEFSRQIMTLNNVLSTRSLQPAMTDTAVFSEQQKQRLEALGY